MSDDSNAESDSSARLAVRGISAVADLNDLEFFARVVEKSGFSRAARELGVPASTVSRRVARLEENLGVRLLQRTTRTMHLTEVGRIYFEQISRALRQIEGAEISLMAAQGSPRGLVRISTIGENFIERILYDFLAKFPEVSFEIDKSHDRVDLVAEGYDLAIRAGVLEDSSLIAHKLMATGSVLCASPQYLEARGVPKTVGELRSHDCVIAGTSSSAATWQLSSPDGGVQRISVSGRLAVNGLGSAVEGCRRGFGIGLFPRSHISPWLASGELVPVLPELSPPPGGLWLVYPSRTLQAPATLALIDHIQVAFQGDTSGVQEKVLLAYPTPLPPVSPAEAQDQSESR